MLFEKKSTPIKIQKDRIRFYFYIGSLLPITFLATILSLVYLQSLKKEHSADIEQLSTSILFEKKIFLRNAVERTISLIDNMSKDVVNDQINKDLTPEQVELKIKKKVGKIIRNLRLTKNNGYLWVNRIVNYEGGEHYAIRQIHPNLPNTEGMWLSTNTVDIKGNKPYEAELNGIKQNGELFFNYYFKKMESDVISHKMSFVKLYKPYNWVIGTGIELDDMDEMIKTKNLTMLKRYSEQKKLSFIILLITILALVFIITCFEKAIRKLIISYENKIVIYTEKLEHLSTTDQLTGLYNRLFLDDFCINLIEKAKRYNHQFSIIMADLDKFKSVNDTYGHQVGDCVLKELAIILKNNVRSLDTVGRWGGEEFLIICLETDLTAASILAEKIREMIASYNFKVIGSKTASFGVACFKKNDSSISNIIERADKALYSAKEQGRNIVKQEV